MNYIKTSHDNGGFTLIELSLVLFIVSLLLGGLLMPYATSVEQRDREDTAETLENIKEALYGYALVNGHLPCPDCETVFGCAGGDADDVVDDGLEDRVNATGVCVVPTVSSNVTGNLPWATLSVPQLDAWEKPFTYSVTAAFAVTTPLFDLTTNGAIDILDQDGAATPLIAQNIPAIIVSHGKNHYVPVQSADEVENFDRNAAIFGTTNNILTTYSGDTAGEFVYKEYTLISGQIAFDDMMIWLSPFVLKNKLIAAGRLP